MRASRVLAVTATACAAMAFSAPLAGADNGPVSAGSGQTSVGNDQAGTGTGTGTANGQADAGGGKAVTDGDQGAGGNGQANNGTGQAEQGNGRTGRGNSQGDARRGPSTIQVNPYSVHQGGTIRITVDGCFRGGSVTSNAFPKTQLSAASSGHASATARIYDRATPGTYNLAVRCNGSDPVATRQFTVVSGRGALGGLGGSVRPSSTEMAVGAGLVATAAVGGTLFVARRRRTLGAF